jgi:two-component system KDP operon response regulator KdpE
MPLETNLTGSEALSRGTGPSVLVIEEDPALRRLLRRELTGAGYRVQDVEPGQRALGFVGKSQFDLLILDIDASVTQGPQAIRVARGMSQVPILALSVHGKEDAMVNALDSGADDYVLKPFGTKELLARVKNALRRRALEQGRPVKVVSGEIEIDLLHRRVRSGGREVRLPPKSYEVLRVLAESAGKVVAHEAILAAVWGPRHVDREYLRREIRTLRRKLEADPGHPRHIVTEPRVGYRLEARE